RRSRPVRGRTPPVSPSSATRRAVAPCTATPATRRGTRSSSRRRATVRSRRSSRSTPSSRPIATPSGSPRCAPSTSSRCVTRCSSRSRGGDMEDRETPVLYLEMTEVTPDDYARSRGTDVRALPGVERATWWRNVYRDRPDLPRELPEFDTLAVYECTPSFVAPDPPAGITGHHFLRTPRPGQGRLTGKPTVSLSLVLISPTAPAEAQALRDWGDFVHIKYIVEAGVPGFTMITPYENATGGDPRYLHFYE